MKSDTAKAVSSSSDGVEGGVGGGKGKGSGGREEWGHHRHLLDWCLLARPVSSGDKLITILWRVGHKKENGERA